MNTIELLEYFVDGTPLNTNELLFLNSLNLIQEKEQGCWTITNLGFEKLKQK